MVLSVVRHVISEPNAVQDTISKPCLYGVLLSLLCFSGPDPLRFLCVALRIEISTRCVFCVAGRISIGFFVLTKLSMKTESKHV